MGIYRIEVAATILSAVLLGGCLSEDEPTQGFNGNDIETQNSAPTISGNPQTEILMGESYSFTPTVSDPDGDNLTFSVQNLPTWAAFDNSTGEVSGQPSLADVGIFDGLIISVSDGTASASLTAFSITVSQAAPGSVTLSWTPPTENVDGTVLTDLAGYRIYYGLSEGNYPNSIEINTAGLASYTIDNLVPQTYYFVATSVNSTGIESSYSNVSIKNVQ